MQLLLKTRRMGCEGYWDREMNWHPGENFDFCGWMVEDVLKQIQKTHDR